eukprot:3932081-Rhodomonas_salina.2
MPAARLLVTTYICFFFLRVESARLLAELPAEHEAVHEPHQERLAQERLDHVGRLGKHPNVVLLAHRHLARVQPLRPRLVSPLHLRRVVVGRLCEAADTEFQHWQKGHLLRGWITRTTTIVALHIEGGRTDPRGQRNLDQLCEAKAVEKNHLYSDDDRHKVRRQVLKAVVRGQDYPEGPCQAHPAAEVRQYPVPDLT